MKEREFVDGEGPGSVRENDFFWAKNVGVLVCEANDGETLTFLSCQKRVREGILVYQFPIERFLVGDGELPCLERPSTHYCELADKLYSPRLARIRSVLND